MKYLDLVMNWAISWASFSVSLVLGIILLFFINKFFQERIQASADSNKIYYQLTLFVLANLLVLLLIINTPLSETLKSQLISLMGIAYTAAIALSSTTFMGNVMAGLMVKVLNKMRPGDFVKVDENFGRITELGLLHTEIQTQDRDLITLPNLYLVSNPVRVIRYSGTIISEEVSLGYDIHHNEVEKSLIRAAKLTELEEPFMHVQALGDFSVTYKISGFLKEIKSILSTKAKLRENLLDCLHQDKIEIVSPNFMNQRVLPVDGKFIPKYQRDTAEVSSESPENIIFDKADEAESIENIKTKIEDIQRDINDLKRSQNAKDEESQNKIQKLESRKSLLNELVKKRTHKE